MDENSGKKQEAAAGNDDQPTNFRAKLSPHRSLSPRGFVILMSCVGLVSFVAGTAFLVMGAWPVFGFFGLDVLLIYIAFKLNYRDGRAYETVELTPNLLRLTRVSSKGVVEDTVDFNPYWVRVLVSEAADGRTRLSLKSHGKETVLGTCLSDDERVEFADVLSGVLTNARIAHN